MWEYALTAEEEAICVEVGYQRQKPYFGDPSKNINYAEGDLWELWLSVKRRVEKGEVYRSHPYKAVGWIFGRDAMKPEWQSQYKNKSWYVPRSSLNPMPNRKV